MVSSYTALVALFAAIGSFLFGFDNGIVTTTISHESWIEYMDDPSDGLTGAVVSLYVAGEAIGAVVQIVCGDMLGRLRFMQLLCGIVTIGTVIQTAAVNIGMFLAGRLIAGVAVGGLVSTIPIYLIEISTPGQRGLIGGLSGCGIAFGTMISNWVGFACAYAPYGVAQWRIPLALQIPWGIILFVGLVTFMPDSPRQLLRYGKSEQARLAFKKVHRNVDSEETENEFRIMRNQIQYEMDRDLKSYREIFSLYGRRVAVSVSIQVMSSLTGVNVIQYYQTTLYNSLGATSHLKLALSGVYGTICFICNVFMILFLLDQWGRRKVLILGMAAVCAVDIYAAVMERIFKNSSNDVGKGFSIAAIYLFGTVYYLFLGSTVWLYAAEVLPLHLRSRINGLASAAHFVINIAITEAAPTAFANIGENYYYVFVACMFLSVIIAYFYFPETRMRSLEDIAAAFGDEGPKGDDGYERKDDVVLEEIEG